MSFQSLEMGVSSTSDNSYTSIFAVPPDPNKALTIPLVATTGFHGIGQVYEFSVDANGYVPLDTKEAFIASTAQKGVLLQDISQSGTEYSATLQFEGVFLQDKLTPSDIPLGAYADGSIIIKKGGY